MLHIDSDLQAVLLYFVPPFLLVLAPPVLAFTVLRRSKRPEPPLTPPQHSQGKRSHETDQDQLQQ